MVQTMGYRNCGIRWIKRNTAIPARATGDGRPYGYYRYQNPDYRWFWRCLL